MIDSQSAVSSAVYAALNSDSTVAGLADVWQNPPEDTQPVAKGLVIVGLVALEAAQSKSDDFDHATVDVFTYVRKPDATQLYALNTAVRNALVEQEITADGADISNVVFLAADPTLMEDGETYTDRLRFEMWVQPA